VTIAEATLVRPAYRLYKATVKRAERLSPHFARITFGSDDFEHFGTAGQDQRIKIFFPLADGTLTDFGQHDDEQLLGDWYDRWRELPLERRNPFRTYTVRRVAPEAREVTVDFVVHHDAGPAGTWASQARGGEQVVICGPDERSPHSRAGIDYRPANAHRLLLIGDETAVPAIGGILERMPQDRIADVFLEVPSADDVAVFELPHGGVQVRWIVRESEETHGEALIQAVTAWAEGNPELLARAASPRPQEIADVDIDRELLWDSPEAMDGEFYAWIAGEAATIKALRRMLVSGHGVDRRRVAFMGYWRRGVAERIG